MPNICLPPSVTPCAQTAKLFNTGEPITRWQDPVVMPSLCEGEVLWIWIKLPVIQFHLSPKCQSVFCATHGTNHERQYKNTNINRPTKYFSLTLVQIYWAEICAAANLNLKNIFYYYYFYFFLFESPKLNKCFEKRNPNYINLICIVSFEYLLLKTVSWIAQSEFEFLTEDSILYMFFHIQFYIGAPMLNKTGKTKWKCDLFIHFMFGIWA